MNIAFLGLGAMGARMATRLVDAGHDVVVWTRSDARPTPAGARRESTPAAAVATADIVISMVRDDAAARAVWLGADGALARMREGAIGVECSTLSLPFVAELAAAFARANRPLLDAPLAGSRPQAEAGQLIFVVGGDVARFDAARPVFDAMGSAVHHCGANGAGALAKLMINALFGVQLAAMAELIGLARRTPHDVATVLQAVTSTPVASPAAKLASGAMLGDQFPAAFPIDLVAKDFGLLVDSAAAQASAVPIGEAAREVYRAAAEDGFADDNITGVVQRYV